MTHVLNITPKPSIVLQRRFQIAFLTNFLSLVFFPTVSRPGPKVLWTPSRKGRPVILTASMLEET